MGSLLSALTRSRNTVVQLGGAEPAAPSRPRVFQRRSRAPAPGAREGRGRQRAAEQRDAEPRGELSAVLKRSEEDLQGAAWPQPRRSRSAALQRVIRTAQKIIGCDLPSLDDLYSSHCSKKVQKILGDPSHPGHHLFDLLPSGRRYRVIKMRITRLQNSFYPSAVLRLNATT